MYYNLQEFVKKPTLAYKFKIKIDNILKSWTALKKKKKNKLKRKIFRPLSVKDYMCNL